jgi:PKD repeat protein/pimeloyl-ACP methyl ester carboxylesterase
MKSNCLFIAILFSTNVFAQTYLMPTSGSVSYTTCSGNFYDDGGSSNYYSPNVNSIITLYPATPGAKISVSFSSFSVSTNGDTLFVYNGNNTTAPQIGKLSGASGYGTITSSAADGSLTFRFVSDNNIFNGETGWAATISCSASPPTDITMIASGSFTTCGGNFYDGGGPNGYYMPGQNTVVTLYPATPGSRVSVSFSSFSVSTNGDTLFVYNGNNTTAPQIGKLSGASGYGTITSSAADGSLTFRFVSDNNIFNGETGWAATISCSASPPTDITMIASGSFTTCGGNFYDDGGPNGNYMPGQNTVVTLYPATAGAKISVSFSSFSATQSGDTLFVYNGNSILTTPADTLTGTANPGIITSSSSDGSLTFRFVSDNNSFSGENGWAATISCSGVNIPTVNSITFTNEIDGNSSLPSLYTLYSGSPFVTNTPIKICSDGSTATHIEVNVSDPSGIGFRILDENDQPINDADKYGVLGTANTLAGGNVEVAYTHPQYMDAVGISRRLTLQVLYNNSPIIGINFPLDIYRAPIVFVHGLWGDATTFENTRNSLISNNLYPSNTSYIREINFSSSYSPDGLPFGCSNCNKSQEIFYNPLMHLVDYYKTSGSSFYTNARENIIAKGIDSVFKTARNNNYSCGKVILIGHSMGGILSRLYLQSTYSSSINYRNDIQKLITINTPHFGTQVANFLLAPENVYLRPLFRIQNWTLSDFLDAVRDLKVNSYAITHDLNIPIASQNVVASHTISTSVSNPFSLSAHKGDAIFVKSTYCEYYPVLGWICANIFHSESNDEIVPLSSQQGGFPWTEVDINRFHVGSPNSNLVLNDVKELINSSPNNSIFSESGFVQHTLNYKSKISGQLPNARIFGDSINILNIVDSQSFNSGDSITISFSNSSQINNIKAFLTGGTNSIFLGSTNVSNSSIKFQSDSSEIGFRMIYLIGFDSTRFIAMDSVRINLNTSAQLDSIKIFPREVDLPEGYSEQITINGYYQDNTVKNLKNISGLTLSFDTTKLKVDTEYKATNKAGPYNVMLVAKFQNKEDTILVMTTSNQTDNIADFVSDADSFCAGSEISYSDASLGIVQSRVWEFPGGTPASSTLQNPVVTYSLPGTYDVKLIANFNGKADTISRSNYITINALSPTPTITAAGVTNFCDGDSITLTSDASGGNQWYNNGIAINDSTRKSFTATSSGSYTVIVTSNSCPSLQSNAIVVTVNPIPSTPTINQNGNQLNSSSTSGNQWFLNGVAISGETGQIYNPTVSGNYTVQVIKNGCSSAFSNSISFIVTSVPNISVYGEQIKVFPNPVKGKLTIVNSTNSPFPLNITLIEISGEQLKVINSSDPVIEIDMTRYSNGIYILRIESKENKIKSYKMIEKIQ